jgi:hypothetical protein
MRPPQACVASTGTSGSSAHAPCVGYPTISRSSLLAGSSRASSYFFPRTYSACVVLLVHVVWCHGWSGTCVRVYHVCTAGRTAAGAGYGEHTAAYAGDVQPGAVLTTAKSSRGFVACLCWERDKASIIPCPKPLLSCECVTGAVKASSQQAGFAHRPRTTAQQVSFAV